MEYQIHISCTKVTLIRMTLKFGEIPTSLLSSLKHGACRGPREGGVVLGKVYSLSASVVTFPKTCYCTVLQMDVKLFLAKPFGILTFLWKILCSQNPS